MTPPTSHLRRTFLLTLPSGEKVRCWQKDALKLREDIEQHGQVYLLADTKSEVYDRVAPGTVEASMMDKGAARRVDGRQIPPSP